MILTFLLILLFITICLLFLFAANIIASSGSMFGRLFPFSSDNETGSPVYLNPLQVSVEKRFIKAFFNCLSSEPLFCRKKDWII
jgi:hypothetical protein